MEEEKKKKYDSKLSRFSEILFSIAVIFYSVVLLLGAFGGVVALR